MKTLSQAKLLSRITLVTCSLIFLTYTPLPAQTGGSFWNGKKCSVVLTYDDALNVHLDKVIPLLDSMRFKATFYLSGFFPGCRDRIIDWRRAAASGHELGNHMVYHPCLGDPKGREWVSPERKMESYSLVRLDEEIKMNNILLNAIDGKTKRTFAYPCGDTRVRDSLYLDTTAFVAARGTRPGIMQVMKIELNDIGCISINGNTGDQMISYVKQAMTEGGLLVFLFHGVGGEHSLNVAAEEHRKLILFLKQHERDILVATMADVANMVKKYQARTGR